MNENNNYSEYTNSVFEQPWWLNIAAKDRWNEIFLNLEDGKVARFVYCYDKKKKDIYMPKNTQNLGVYISNEQELGLRERKDIYYQMLDRLPKFKKLNIRLNVNNDYVLPFFWRDFFITPNFTYRINDLSNIDLIYSNFSDQAKKNIKTASKKVNIEFSDNIDILIELIRNTYLMQNRKISNEYIQFIKNVFKLAGENKASKLIYAKDNEGNYHSGTLFVYDKNVTYYLLAGSNSEYNKKSRANTLIIWEGIKFASTVSNVFDFEGSMIESIESFVKQFGGKPTVYYTIEKRTIFQHLFLFYRRKIKKLIGYKQ